MQYDYIIIGAGSSGCVMADELSSDPANRVLLVESGPSDNNMLIDMPRGIGKILNPESPYVWAYEIDRGAIGGTETWLKGKAIGGSSSINGMIYARGFATDYDGWEASGCSGWGWKDLLPHFVAHEDHELQATAERGRGGPLKVSNHPQDDNGPAVRKLTDALLKAMAEAGVPTTDDTNAAPEGGAGYQPRTIYRGKRQSAALAFLRPAMQRPNLTVIHSTHVQRIVFAGKRATGIEVVKQGQATTYACGKEVILCAGAIESPKLLQLSGVGPAGHLQQLGIAVVHDAPAVGQNLQEHFYLQTKYRVTDGSLNQQFTGAGLLKAVLRYFISHKGPMTHAAQELIAYIKSDQHKGRPDCQLGIGLYTIEVTEKGINPEKQPGITIGGYPVHPTSRGELLITSKDSRVAPKIIANYLQTPEDQATAVAMIRAIREIAAQPALRGLIVDELAPGKRLQTDAELLQFYRDNGVTAYHVAGTCRMGSDADAVVDVTTRVNGVEGVRVVDTSIFPCLPTGNTNALAMAVGRHAGKMIRQGR